MIPWAAPNTGDFDPELLHFSTIWTGSPNYAYSGGVLATDGNIYLVPKHADDIGILNPVTKNFTVMDICNVSSSMCADNKYHSGVLANNGHIYFVPRNADNIGDLNPGSRSFSVIDISSLIDHNVKFCAGVQAPNGRIYMVPRNSPSLGVFDPETTYFTLIDISFAGPQDS